MRSVYLVGILLCVAIAQAQEFRGGFVQWRSTGTNKVQFYVYTAWSGSQGSVSVDLGDGTVVDASVDEEVVLWSGNDLLGNAVVLQRRDIAHTYATSGVYTTFFPAASAPVNRPASLTSGASSKVKVATVVDTSNAGSVDVLSLPVNTLGEKFNVLPLAVNNADGEFSEVQCRFSTLTEAGGELAPYPVVSGETASVTTDCQFQWDTSDFAHGERHAVQVRAYTDATHYTEATFELQLSLNDVPSCSISDSEIESYVCSPATVSVSVASGDDNEVNHFVWGSPEVLGSLTGVSLESANSLPINSATWNIHPTGVNVGEAFTVALGFVSDSNSWVYCPLSMRLLAKPCDSIVNYDDYCSGEDSDKKFYFNALGNGVASWSTDCTGGSFDRTYGCDVTLTIASGSDEVCSVTVVTEDSCFGTQQCVVPVESTCCLSGFDECGVCGGNNESCQDCSGVVNGDLEYDDCGVCGGDGTSCCHNYLGISNDLWDYILVPEAVSDLIERLETTYAVVEWLDCNLPEMEELPERVTCDLIGAVAEINRMFLFDCGLEKFCKSSGSFLTSLEHATQNYLI